MLEQIVLTEEEINDQACHWLSDILKEEEEDIVDRDGNERSEDYKNLISLLLGSHHAHYMKPVEDVLPRTLDFSSKEGEKIKKRLGKILVLIGRITSLICYILVGGSILHESDTMIPTKKVKFNNLKDMSLGHPHSIIFWNDQQVRYLYRNLSVYLKNLRIFRW